MWKTRITKTEPNHIVTRGYKQEELIGTVPFSHVFFLLIKGRMPDKNEAVMIDALITSSIDHGVTPPSTHASRIVASAGVPLPTAVAAGILAVGDIHGGAIEDGARILQEWVKKMHEHGWNAEETAHNLLTSLKKDGKTISLKWLPHYRLIKSFSKETEVGKSSWILEDKIIDPKQIKKAFTAWENYQTTDYTDIGDNESDPFLMKMINLGFVEHGASGFYDAQGNTLEGEHHH